MSLYRKYRPQTFSDMVGQAHIKLTLQNELEQGSFVHAYLFCGPRGLGKTTAARLFAKSVNCENRKSGESEPCNKCSSCQDIMNSRSLDLIEIDAASHTGVDNVRENIIENTRFSPHKSKFKVFIIDEVHMLSISAFNALLKTLEEPPAYTIFILCTTELHKVPATIISRCQRFDFKKVPAGEAVKRLKRLASQEEIQLDHEIFDIIAVKSEGCMRDAETLLGQVLSLGGKQIAKEQAALVLPMSDIKLVFDCVNLIVHHNASSALEFINGLVEDGVDLEIFTKELIEFLRKLILMKMGNIGIGLLDWSSGLQTEVDQILAVTDISSLVTMINTFLTTSQTLKLSPIPQLPLELAIIKICDNSGSCGFQANTVKTPAFRNPAISQENKLALTQKRSQPKKQENNSSPTGNQASGIKQEQDNGKLNMIKAKWVDIIKAGHKQSRDLMFINEKMVWPLSINGDLLEVGFKYDLHRSRFEANGNQQIFSDALKEILGEKLNTKIRTLKPSEVADLDIEQAGSEQPELTGTKVTEDNILEQVLDSFGGEVVE